MNSFILYIYFSSSTVNLRLLATKMLFLSAASSLQNRAVTNFPTSLQCLGYKWGSESWLQLQGVRSSPGLWSSKNTQESHIYLPLLTLFPLVCHGAALLTADPWHCSHYQLCVPMLQKMLYVHISTPWIHSFPDTIFFIWPEFTLSSQSHLGAKTVTSPVLTTF